MNINLPLDPRLRPPDGTRQPPPPSHQSQGGKRYSDDLRRQLLQMHFNNYDLREAPELVALRAARKFPSFQHASVGSKFSIRPVTSAHCVILATIMRRGRCKAWPSNSWLSINAFFPRPLLPSAGHIYSILNKRPVLKFAGTLGRETSWTEADTASMMACHGTWPCVNIIGCIPPPLGMRGVPIADIMDINEAGFFLEHSD